MNYKLEKNFYSLLLVNKTSYFTAYILKIKFTLKWQFAVAL